MSAQVTTLDGTVKSVTGGGRVKYDARTEEGALVIVYLPAEMARENVAIAIKPKGRKVKVEQAEEQASDVASALA